MWYVDYVDCPDTSEVVFKLGDMSFLNQHPWMHLNLNAILYA